tara:strand:+ start:103 stop:585 length:483 start_codon:yes stop_codon:yes gene_type:complete
MFRIIWSTIKAVSVILILSFLYFIVFVETSSSTSTEGYKKELEKEEAKFYDELFVEQLESQDCVEFIQLLSAKQIAREYDRTEMWAIQNYKVSVWEKTTTNGKGKKVGEMHCGSRALILERNGEDFKIRSPKDGSIGWVNSVQVDKTLYQNPDTYEKCKG